MDRPFLTARWEDLALLTWRIDAGLLHAYLPPGLEPDRLPDDPPGTAYVSFVAFRFVDTAVKGIKVPLHTDFPEVNLRFYVRTTDDDEPRRGVAFIAELVPKAAITAVANVLYHEHYRTVPMSVTVQDQGGTHRRMTTTIELGERTHTMSLLGQRPPERPPSDSVEHFFKEHSWGFGNDGSGGRVTYRVDHPVWDVYPVDPEDLTLDVDFHELYGPPWACLDQSPPTHIAYAVGSEIAVYPRED